MFMEGRPAVTDPGLLNDQVNLQGLCLIICCKHGLKQNALNYSESHLQAA